MHLKLSKGHNFKLVNYPIQKIADVSMESSQIILHPLSFPYIKPKLLIKDGLISNPDEIDIATTYYKSYLTLYLSNCGGWENPYENILDNIYFHLRLLMQ